MRKQMELVGTFDVLPILGSHVGCPDDVVSIPGVVNPSFGANVPTFERVEVDNFVVIGPKRDRSLLLARSKNRPRRGGGQ